MMQYLQGFRHDLILRLYDDFPKPSNDRDDHNDGLGSPTRGSVAFSNHLSFVITGLLVAAILLNPNQALGQSKAVNWPLGSFHFDFARLGSTQADQIEALHKLGYEGMVFNLANQAQLRRFDDYLKVVQDSEFKIYAAYVPLTLKKDNSKNYAHIKKVLNRLAKADASLWVMIKDENLDQSEIVKSLAHIADMAAAAYVEFVIYPHDRNRIESAEEALEYIEALGRDDVFVSLHLCHEIRAGNGERLNEVAAKIKPWLRLPSISGTDTAYGGEASTDWSRNIKPLGEGDYDASKLLAALKSINYEGPVLLHTFGLQQSPIGHHSDSIKVYREMLKKLRDHD